MAVEMKEESYVCSDAQLDEIHKALIQEFEAVSRKQIEQKIRLYNGILQQELASRHLYKFETPNEPEKTIEPDKPYILSIDGKVIDGSIYSVTEQYIEIELKESYGQLIPSIDVIIDLRILLDLIDRRIVLLDREPNKFKINSAKFLFYPDPAVSIPSLNSLLSHAKRKDHSLNTEQENAIHASLKNKLTIIWGPPGTGKTRTLQGVIAELLVNGKKVLFASNTNNAIDGLLKGFVIKEKTPYVVINDLREEGKIIRIGSQTNDDIEMVFSPRAVLEQKAEKIAIQIRELENNLRKENEILGKLKEELNGYNKALQLKSKINDLRTKLSQIPSNDELLLQIKALENSKNSLAQEFLKYEPSIFSNTGILRDLAESLKILKEKISGINVQINRFKKEFDQTEQRISDLNLEAEKLSKSIFKKMFAQEKLAEIRKSLSEQREKWLSLESKIPSYENQQKSLIESEAQITGQFVQEFKKFIEKTEASDLNLEQIERSLKNFNFTIKLTGNRPLWLQYGFELGLCSEEQIQKLSFIRAVRPINQERIIEKFQARKNDLEYRLKNSEELKLKIRQNIQHSESELNQIKHLLDKPSEHWSSLKKGIDTFYENRIHPIQTQIESLKAKIQELEKTLIAEARLVCCTLVKASYDETLMNCAFDVLVVDEVSMALLPQLYCAAALTSERIVLCGDHLQLQPISISQGEYALKWLKKSYFDFVEEGNTDYEKYKKLNKLLPFLARLSRQFRMPAEIAELVRPWYIRAGNVLQDEEISVPIDIKLNGHFLKEGTIFFLDTSSLGSYHSRTSDRSPYNLINAAIVAEVVRQLLEEYQIDQKQIFCIAPYRAQYQFTWALLKKFSRNSKEIRQGISNSVHKIQGDEAPIVIYDLTDGRQKGFTGFIKTPELYIHNVAITRSQAKLVFVGDMNKLKGLQKLDTPQKPSLSEILDNLKEAKIIDATPYKEKIFRTYTVEDLLEDGTIIINDEQRNNIVILTSSTYYKVLKNDIRNAKYSIFIVSPFVTRNRWEKIKPSLLRFCERNPQGKIKIITRPPDQMFERNKINMMAVEILNEFLNLGFEVKVSKNIHAKLVVIDQGTKNAISYWGSLNPLSFKNTDEINTRLEGAEIAEKLINMSLVGNLKAYKGIPLKKDQLFNHTTKSVKKQMEDFRWVLAGYYHRPIGAICRNTTIEQILKLLPKTREEYSQIEEFRRNNFVLWNHIDEINEMISPLRAFSKTKKPSAKQASLFD